MCISEASLHFRRPAPTWSMRRGSHRQSTNDGNCDEVGDGDDDNDDGDDNGDDDACHGDDIVDDVKMMVATKD